MVFDREKIAKQVEQIQVLVDTLEDKARINKRKFLRLKRSHVEKDKELTKVKKDHKKLKELLDLERLAELEHDQWVFWTKAIAAKVPEELKEQWERYWIPYSELPEHVKDQDRAWARMVRNEK